VLAPCDGPKLVPVIVTEFRQPEVGDRLMMLGAETKLIKIYKLLIDEIGT